VQCWGYNGDGRLGNGTTIGSTEPVTVTGVSDATAIAVGATHACALLRDGNVKCWGANNHGQLGDGQTNSASSIPVTVKGIDGMAKAIAAGDSATCAVLVDDRAVCWGSNAFGELGRGVISTTAPLAAPVIGLSNVSSISVGDQHACAVLNSGSAKCWGDGYYGQLGNANSGPTYSETLPVDVQGLSNVLVIGAMWLSTCALLTDGSVSCWGYNYFGQAGNGTADLLPHAVPQPVQGLGSADGESQARALAVGYASACAVLVTGRARCWGKNQTAQLGDGTTTHRTTPVAVDGLSGDVDSLALGGHSSGVAEAHTCALLKTGSVWCWGHNSQGQLGSGQPSGIAKPTDVVGIGNAVHIAAGQAHSCAVLVTGDLKCWGANTEGMLGNGTRTPSQVPTDVLTLNGMVSHVVAGYLHTCALLTNGGMKCWGYGDYNGAIGNGNFETNLEPADVIQLGGTPSVISAGNKSTCALLGPNQLKCWGLNSYGESGDGTFERRAVPGNVIGLGNGITAISANSSASSHKCAVVNGTAQCWGGNDYGQLGDGTTFSRTQPVAALGLRSGIKAITTGANHTCALNDDGGVNCWGNGTSGQLGNGTTPSQSPPVTVTGLLSGVQAISAGESHTCALLNSGGVKCWGRNNYGQLGSGDITYRYIPTDVIGLTSGVKEISVGYAHACALLNTGGVKCWGENYSGQLGTGTAWRTTPALVPMLLGGAQKPAPDSFEPDDICDAATRIESNGQIQQHNFHGVNDQDWVWFNAISGTRYLLEASVLPGAEADLKGTLQTHCKGSSLPPPDKTLGLNEWRQVYTATHSGPVYIKLENQSVKAYGDKERYNLSVRDVNQANTDGVAVIVVGRSGADDHVITETHTVANRAYDLFFTHGQAVRYLAAEPSRAGLRNALPATLASLSETLTSWVSNTAPISSMLTLVMVSHGDTDSFHLDKSSGQTLGPDVLNAWLNQLQRDRSDLKINVIVEACYSGGFIATPKSISAPGRVVITSASATQRAKVSEGGTAFLDNFLTRLDEAATFYDAFLHARAAVAGLGQSALLDDTGDGLSDDGEDGALARSRWLSFLNIWRPVIQQPSADWDSEITISTDVITNTQRKQKLSQVWAVVYRPGYTPEGRPDQLVSDRYNPLVQVVLLGWDAASQRYKGSAPWKPVGVHHISIHAKDDGGNLASPVRLAAGYSVFLPVVMR
jgi:alpha-tubulin suppressor-like RCC1 family protein